MEAAGLEAAGLEAAGLEASDEYQRAVSISRQAVEGSAMASSQMAVALTHESQMLVASSRMAVASRRMAVAMRQMAVASRRMAVATNHAYYHEIGDATESQTSGRVKEKQRRPPMLEAVARMELVVAPWPLLATARGPSAGRVVPMWRSHTWTPLLLRIWPFPWAA